MESAQELKISFITPGYEKVNFKKLIDNSSVKLIKENNGIIMGIPENIRTVNMNLDLKTLNKYYDGYFKSSMFPTELLNNRSFWILDYIIRHVFPKKFTMFVEICDGIDLRMIKEKILPNIRFDKIENIHNIQMDKSGLLTLTYTMKIDDNQYFFINISNRVECCDGLYSNEYGIIRISKNNYYSSPTFHDNGVLTYVKTFNILTLFPDPKDMPHIEFNYEDTNDQRKLQATKLTCFWFNKFQNTQPLKIILHHNNLLYFKRGECIYNEKMNNENIEYISNIFGQFSNMLPRKINKLFHITYKNELNFYMIGNYKVLNSAGVESLVYFHIKFIGKVNNNIKSKININESCDSINLNQILWYFDYTIYLDTNRESFYNYFFGTQACGYCLQSNNSLKQQIDYQFGCDDNKEQSFTNVNERGERKNISEYKKNKSKNNSFIYDNTICNMENIKKFRERFVNFIDKTNELCNNSSEDKKTTFNIKFVNKDK